MVSGNCRSALGQRYATRSVEEVGWNVHKRSKEDTALCGDPAHSGGNRVWQNASPGLWCANTRIDRKFINSRQAETEE